MSAETLRDLANKYKFYHFTTIEDFENGIDYDGNKVDINKYYERGIIKNASGTPTYYQGYGLK